MIGIAKRTWDRLTPWPSSDERDEAERELARRHAAAIHEAHRADELTAKIRTIRRNNGFREAFEMALSRGKPQQQS